MDGHLVTIEVGVVGRADQRVQFDGSAFDQNRFERLDAEAVQRRGAVQQDGVVLDDFFQGVPDEVIGPVDQAAGGFDVVGMASLDNFLHDERLKQLKRHFFGQAALVQLEFRADDDNRTTGVVDTLTEEVLAETALFAFQEVRERLEGAIAGTGDGTATAAIIDQGVNSLLEHALFVADDDFRRTKLEQLVETVVAVDDAAVEVVEVGGRKAATVELDHRAQFRRQDGQDIEDHPVWAVAGFLESFDDFQALDDADLLLAAGGAEFFAQIGSHLVDVDRSQEFFDRFGTHLGAEGILAIGVDGVAVFLVRDDLALREGGLAGIDHNISGEIEDFFQVSGSHVQEQAHPARDTPEIPDMRNRCGQLDVAEALAANFGFGDFDTAAVANDALITDLLVLAAVAFPVLGRAKDLFAEQAVAFRFERTVINGFRLFNFAAGPFEDFFR